MAVMRMESFVSTTGWPRLRGPVSELARSIGMDKIVIPEDEVRRVRLPEGTWDHKEEMAVVVGSDREEENLAVRARSELAEAVSRVLGEAGLPVLVYTLENGGQSGMSGAFIEYDEGGDGTESVYIGWRPAESLAAKVDEKLMCGDTSAPEIERSGEIAEIMRDAMIQILSSAGYNAFAADDDDIPIGVEVSMKAADADAG